MATNINIPDETEDVDHEYAQELQLQEALMASLITTSQNTDNDNLIMKIIESSQKGFDETIAEPSQTLCEICTEKMNRKQMFPLHNCTHNYCTECISKYVSVTLQKSSSSGTSLLNMACPGLDCEGVIKIDKCREMLPNDVIAAWDGVICESMIDPKQKFYCPYKNCSALLDKDDGNVSEAECPYCRRLFCAKCNVPWHCGVECKEFVRLNKNKRKSDDAMVHELAKKKKWQRCPNCSFYVEKKDGCLHMTCRCSHQFCYACGATWSSTHGGCQ